MANSNAKKVTGKKAATDASGTLRDKRTSKDSKTGAGSALSQRKAPNKTTSPKAATASSKTLGNKLTSGKAKTSAGSALSQTTGNKKK